MHLIDLGDITRLCWIGITCSEMPAFLMHCKQKNLTLKCFRFIMEPLWNNMKNKVVKVMICIEKQK